MGARTFGRSAMLAQGDWVRDTFKRIFNQLFVSFFLISKNFSVCNDLIEEIKMC